MLTNLKQSSAGFSLLEVVVVMVIIAILVAGGYPLYQNHVRETHRTDAKSALVELAQLQEKFYFSEDANGNTNHKYATDFDMLNNAVGLSGIKIVDATTLESREGYYQITLVDPTSKSFTFTAIPTEKGEQNNDSCTEFSIDNIGNKDSEPKGEKCW